MSPRRSVRLAAKKNNSSIIAKKRLILHQSYLFALPIDLLVHILSFFNIEGLSHLDRAVVNHMYRPMLMLCYQCDDLSFDQDTRQYFNSSTIHLTLLSWIIKRGISLQQIIINLFSIAFLKHIRKASLKAITDLTINLAGCTSYSILNTLINTCVSIKKIIITDVNISSNEISLRSLFERNQFLTSVTLLRLVAPPAETSGIYGCQHRHSNITRLLLRACKFYPDSFSTSIQLTHLNHIDIKFKDGGFSFPLSNKQLMDIASASPNVSTFKVSCGTSLQGRTIEHIAYRCKHLSRLDLYDSIDSEWSRGIGAVLAQCPSLVSLFICIDADFSALHEEAIFVSIFESYGARLVRLDLHATSIFSPHMFTTALLGRSLQAFNFSCPTGSGKALIHGAEQCIDLRLDHIFSGSDLVAIMQACNHLSLNVQLANS